MHTHVARLGRKALFVVFVVGFALCGAWPTPAAHAQQHTDRVVAEAMFREGRELMDQNRVAEACAKFAESYKLDRALGTLVNLALCHEKEGKTASAWAEFTDAAAEAVAEKDDREGFCKKHAATLAAELPRVRLVIAPAANALASLEIRLDGHALGRTAWSSPLPIDPGEHDLNVSADEKRPHSAKLTVPKGANVTNVNVPALEDAPKIITVKPVGSDATTDPRVGRTQRLIGYIVGGVGIAGVLVGAGFGLNAISLKGDRDGRCATDGFCDSEGVDKDKSARTSATISTIGFIAGGALVAGGVALVLTAPKGRVVGAARLTPGGIVVGGTF